MIGRIVLVASIVLAPNLLTPAYAQDVPGIEICTVEKTMERRTSCLQSNVDFLMKTIAKLGTINQQKLDAANRQIDGLKSAVVSLQKTVDDLQAAQKKTAEDTKKKVDAPAAKDARQRNNPVSVVAIQRVRHCEEHSFRRSPLRAKADATKQSSFAAGKLDCFAPLAMTRIDLSCSSAARPKGRPVKSSTSRRRWHLRNTTT